MWYERVPTESWSDIIDHYRLNYDRGCWGERYRPIVRLVETIAASSYAPVLFGRPSWSGCSESGSGGFSGPDRVERAAHPER